MISIAVLDSKAMKYNEAVKKSSRALQYFLSKGDTANRPLCYLNLGKFEMGIENCEAALELHKTTGYVYGAVQTLDYFRTRHYVSDCSGCILK